MFSCNIKGWYTETSKKNWRHSCKTWRWLKLELWKRETGSRAVEKAESNLTGWFPNYPQFNPSSYSRIWGLPSAPVPSLASSITFTLDIRLYVDSEAERRMNLLPLPKKRKMACHPEQTNSSDFHKTFHSKLLPLSTPHPTKANKKHQITDFGDKEKEEKRLGLNFPGELRSNRGIRGHRKQRGILRHN